MSGGLFALLDDISVLARAAAASIDDVAAASGRASVKAAGVVVDDTAVTPRYVEGLDPKRELPIIKRITIGSLRNKLLFIVPAILLLVALAGVTLADHHKKVLWRALCVSLAMLAVGILVGVIAFG